MSKHNPYIIDTTLRDGEQTPGVTFSIDEKLKIAALLDELGVDEIEAGTPAIGKEEQYAIQLIAGAGFQFKTSSWCRATVEDIVKAARLGTQSINISLPVSKIQIETLGKTPGWILDQITETVQLAKGLFPHVTLGAQDATRAQSDFLHAFIFQANDAGADRIRLADTVGIFDCIETYDFISGLKAHFPELKFEFHGHNDLGMATGNAISAIHARVDCVSATVNGLGERAGNSALEEIIAYLHFKKGITRFNSSVINQLCQYVAEASDCIIPKQKAITGQNAFKHESGIHTSAIIKNVQSYQVLSPESYGVDSIGFTFGKHSGKASIINFFKSKGIKINDQTAIKILAMIKEQATVTDAKITENDLLKIYNNHYQNKILQ